MRYPTTNAKVPEPATKRLVRTVTYIPAYRFLALAVQTKEFQALQKLGFFQALQRQEAMRENPVVAELVDVDLSRLDALAVTILARRLKVTPEEAVERFGGWFTWRVTVFLVEHRRWRKYEWCCALMGLLFLGLFGHVLKRANVYSINAVNIRKAVIVRGLEVLCRQ